MLALDKNKVVSENEIKSSLKKFFSMVMNTPIAELNDEDSFFSIGLTSLIQTEVVNNLTETFGGLSSTVLFEYPNFNLLARHLAETINSPTK